MSETLLQLPPNADESEREILAAIIQGHPEALDEALASGLRSEHFRVGLHKDTFRASEQLRTKGVEDLDPVAVYQEAEGRIEPDDLAALIGSSYATGNVGYHSRQVMRAAKLRGLKAAYQDGLMLITRGREADEVLATVGKSIVAVLDDQATGPESIEDVLLRLKLGPTETEPGLATGFQGLDDVMSGFRPGNLIVLAARPGHGKTALATCMSLNAARDGHAVLYISLEMSSEELALRLLSLESGIEHSRIRDGKLDAPSMERVATAQNDLSRCPFMIFDRTPLHMSDIAASVRVIARRKNLKLVVIDYLQLIEPADRKVIREQQVAEMSRTLKTLAKSVGIPIVCLAQLNRSIESRDNKRPRLSDLRESGAIEQDADCVLFLTNQAATDAGGEAQIIVGKNRHGRLDDITIDWIGNRMEFRERTIGPGI